MQWMQPLHLMHINHLAMVYAAFSIEGRADGRYRFVLVTEHCANVLTSPNFDTREQCFQGLERLKMVLRKRIGIHILNTGQDAWFFVVMVNNELLAQSRVFTDLESCEAESERVKRLAPMAALAVEA